MKIIVVLLLAACFFPLYGSARLGETRDQCKARYGDELKIETNKDGTTAVSYIKNDFIIIVYYYKDEAVGLCYAKIRPEDAVKKNINNADPIPMSHQEIETLLNNNSGSSFWKLELEADKITDDTEHWKRIKMLAADYQQNVWKRGDKQAEAIYDNIKDMLMFFGEKLFELSDPKSQPAGAFGL
jgi:hypothetical protein